MICVLDYNGYLLEANQAVEKVLGYSLSELKEKPVFELLHPDDRKVFSRRNMLQPGNYEHRYFCGNNSYRWLSWTVVPVLGEELIYALVRDITKQKETEKKILGLAKQAYETLDGVPEAFFVLDSEGSITYLNQKAQELAARDEKDAKGKKIWDIIPQTINSVLYKEFRTIVKEKAPRDFETFHPTRNRWFEVKVRPSGEGVILYYHDITSWKVSEAALKLKERSFRASPFLTALISLPEMTVIDINEKFINTLGLDKDRVIDRPLPEIGIFRQAEQSHALFRAIKEKGLLRNQEITYYTKTGEKRSGLVSGEAVSVEGKYYFLVVVNDITEQKKAEKEAARRDRLKLTAEMAAGIAHEIRNPMTTISGLLQVIAKKTELGRNKEYVDIILAEFNRIKYILEDFLTFGRTTASNIKNQNLGTIIKDIYPLIQAYAAETNKKVTLQIDAVPDLLMDSGEIRTLVLHLCRNGLEAMTEGGTLTLKTYVQGEDVVLAVQDEGPAIPDEVLERMGTPFFTTKEKGSGLGLAKCYSIAGRHRASIRVETGNEGTTFYVIFSPGLPVLEEIREAKTPE
jgi:PAS domain S-box-containing protein